MSDHVDFDILTTEELLRCVAIYEELGKIPNSGALQHALELLGWYVSDINSRLSQAVFERVVGRPPAEKLKLTQGEWIAYVAHVKAWYVLRQPLPADLAGFGGDDDEVDLDFIDVRSMDVFFENLLQRDAESVVEEHRAFETRVGGRRTSHRHPGGIQGRVAVSSARASPVCSPRSVRRPHAASKWWVVIKWFHDRLAARAALMQYWRQRDPVAVGTPVFDGGGGSPAVTPRSRSPRHACRAVERLQIGVAMGETKHALLKRRLFHSQGKPVDKEQERLRKQLLKKRKMRGITPGSAGGKSAPLLSKASPVYTVRSKQRQDRIVDPCVQAGCGTGKMPGVHEMLYHMSYDLNPEAESAVLSRQLFENYLKRSSKGGRYDFDMEYAWPPRQRQRNRSVEKEVVPPRVALMPLQRRLTGGTADDRSLPGSTRTSPMLTNPSARRTPTGPGIALHEAPPHLRDYSSPALYISHRQLRSSGFYDDQPPVLSPLIGKKRAHVVDAVHGALHPGAAGRPQSAPAKGRPGSATPSTPGSAATAAAGAAGGKPADTEPDRAPTPVVDEAQMNVWLKGRERTPVAKRAETLAAATAAGTRHAATGRQQTSHERRFRTKDYSRFMGKTCPTVGLFAVD